MIISDGYDNDKIEDDNKGNIDSDDNDRGKDNDDDDEKDDKNDDNNDLIRKGYRSESIQRGW